MGTKQVRVIRLESSRPIDVFRQCEADGFAACLRGKAWAANPYRSSFPSDTPEVVRRVEREMAHAWLQGWELANGQERVQVGRRKSAGQEGHPASPSA
jgi:hypothetical protein